MCWICYNGVVIEMGWRGSAAFSALRDFWDALERHLADEFISEIGFQHKGNTVSPATATDSILSHHGRQTIFRLWGRA